MAKRTTVPGREFIRFDSPLGTTIPLQIEVCLRALRVRETTGLSWSDIIAQSGCASEFPLTTAHNQPVLETQPRATPPRKKGKFWRIAGLLTLTVAAGATAYGTLTTQGRQVAQTTKQGIVTAWEVQQNPNLLFDNVGDSRVNILLIGEDRNWTIKPVFNPKTGKFAPMNVVDDEAPPRSDTMIVVTLDRDSKMMRMVSFPRDARVRFTDLQGRRHKAGKMNAVYASGGLDPKMREEVLKNFFRDEIGLRVDRVARIRIEGFTGLIDKVGGLDIKVDGALEKDRRTGKLYRGRIQRTDNWGKWSVDLEPGMQHLDGTQAVGYARFRYDREGDPGRIRRQQQVMRALAKEITQTPLPQLPGVVGEAKQQFATDMNDAEMASMALFARNIGADTKISPLTVFGIGAADGSDIILNKPENIKLFSYIFGDSFDERNFLNRSPETTRDELGIANNRNPAAIEVLREAGILPPDGEVEPSPVTEVPVRPSRQAD